jgi:hypothetical protein
MIDFENLLYKDCFIVPFERLPGKIVAINISKKGVEYQVRYYLNGEYKLEWFFDFDLDFNSNFDLQF